MASIKDAMSRSAASGRLYIDFTVTDTPNGNPRFYGSDAPFLASNVWGGAQVYPVVHSWGDLLKDFSGEQSGNATVTLVASAQWTASNGTTSRTVVEWIRQLQLRDVSASIYQWNEETTVQEVIWKGYIRQVDQAYTLNGVQLIDLLLSVTDRDVNLTPVSTLVERVVFPTVPNDSLGKMVPKCYGQAYNRLATGLPRNSVGMVGGPMQGMRGVIVSSNEPDAQFLIYFAQHDGASAAHTFEKGTAGDPIDDSDLWVYDSGLGAYGLVEPGSWAFTNDTARLEVLVDASPLVYFFIRGSRIGEDTDAGVTDMQNLIDSDLNNYTVSTATNNDFAFDIPAVSFNGDIIRAHVVVDWQNAHATKSRQIRFGIWDDHHDPSANWLNTKHETPAAVAASLERRLNVTTNLLGASNGYVGADFLAHLGADTAVDFHSGRFITYDASQAQAALQMKVGILDQGVPNSGTEDVRIYHIILAVQVRYPFINKVRPIDNSHWPSTYRRWLEERRISLQDYRELMERHRGRDEEHRYGNLLISNRSKLADAAGTDFFITGGFQKDNGSGTYSGSASGVIFRPCDIAHHLIVDALSASINTTAGTLGNFDDARDTIMSEMTVLAQFGPDTVMRSEAIEELSGRWPMTVFPDDSIYQCLPDDMNPHSSRLYRSSSDQVFIEPQDIQEGTFRVTEISPDDFVNSIILNHAHGYPNREPGISRTYENRYSQMYFGKKSEVVVDEPMYPHQTFDTNSSNGADDLAEWYGRRSARPRLIASCVLTQKFYDLRRGHVLQFKGLETVGITCPAFRCGLLDYQFKSSTDTVNYGNSLTPTFIATGVANKITFMLQQQTDHLDFMVATAAAHTDVANPWRYGTGLGTEANFANVVNPAAIKSTGAQRVSWDWPIPTAWKKEELTFGAFGVAGPCYPIYHYYTGGSVAGTGSARTHYDAVWAGRVFEVTKVSRQGTGENAYEGVYAEFLEVM